MLGLPARAQPVRIAKRTVNVRAQAAAVTETKASSLVKDPEAAEVRLGLIRVSYCPPAIWWCWWCWLVVFTAGVLRTSTVCKPHTLLPQVAYLATRVATVRQHFSSALSCDDFLHRYDWFWNNNCRMQRP